MNDSLRAEIETLQHDGKISTEERDELLEKVDEHDADLREKAINEVYSVVTRFLVEHDSDLDFNLKLQNKILDLLYGKNA